MTEIGTHLPKPCNAVIKMFVGKQRPDVLHCHDAGVTSFLVAIRLSRCESITCVSHTFDNRVTYFAGGDEISLTEAARLIDAAKAAHAQFYDALNKERRDG